MWDLWETISEGKTWTGEFLNQSKSGELFWVEANISPIRDENSEIVAYLTFQIDISEKKEKEKLIKKNKRLESLSTLAGILSHDFKNILNVINLCTQTIEIEVSEDNDIQQHLNEIFDAVTDANTISRKLMSMAKDSIQEFKPMNLSELIKSERNNISKNMPK